MPLSIESPVTTTLRLLLFPLFPWVGVLSWAVLFLLASLVLSFCRLVLSLRELLLDENNCLVK